MGIRVAAIVAVILAGLFPVHAFAQEEDLDVLVRVGETRQQEGQRSQERVNALEAAREKDLAEFKRVLKEVEGLRVYNSRLERQIEDQIRRLENIVNSIQGVVAIQRHVTPLMVDMVDSLERFVAADLPFHRQERNERVAFLRRNIDRSDLSGAEKFRQVLEAYKIENEYGRKIGTYTDVVAGRNVNVLRVGRIALLAQTTDARRAWVWDRKAKGWRELNGGEYRSILLHGLRMANDQAVIKLLLLPIPAPEEL